MSKTKTALVLPFQKIAGGFKRGEPPHIVDLPLENTSWVSFEILDALEKQTGIEWHWVEPPCTVATYDTPPAFFEFEYESGDFDFGNIPKRFVKCLEREAQGGPPISPSPKNAKPIGWWISRLWSHAKNKRIRKEAWLASSKDFGRDHSKARIVGVSKENLDNYLIGRFQ